MTYAIVDIYQVEQFLNLIVDEESKYNWPGDTFDWKVNPWAALPQCLCVCSQK